jgi:hypothetical protein
MRTGGTNVRRAATLGVVSEVEREAGKLEQNDVKAKAVGTY